MSSLTPSQTAALVIVERTMSFLSLFGNIIVFALYASSKKFRKPIHRMMFYACIGNVGMNVATLISEGGVAAGQDSFLCQFQGFLIQMFLGVDAYWALCMSFNVYLAFFREYTIHQLKALDLIYLSLCYGLAFIPAFLFVLLSNASRGRVYGPAVIWCWIGVEWGFLRISTLYGIVWLASLIAMVIYAFAARRIYKKRNQLGGYLNPFNEHPFSITWEVKIISEARTDEVVLDPSTELDTHDIRNFRQYECDIQAQSSLTRKASIAERLNIANISREVARKEPNEEAWLYARAAFLFYVTILITWVPSSVYRVSSLVHPSDLNYPLSLASSVVLPLQGFWNMVVFLLNSQAACKQLYEDISDYVLFMRRKRSTSTETSNNIPMVPIQRRHLRRLGSESNVAVNQDSEQTSDAQS